MEDVEVITAVDEVRRRDAILVYLKLEYRSLLTAEANHWNLPLIVTIHCEIEVAILSWHRNLILTHLALIVLLVVPRVLVSLAISIVSNLKVLEAREEIRMTDKEDAIG